MPSCVAIEFSLWVGFPCRDSRTRCHVATRLWAQDSALGTYTTGLSASAHTSGSAALTTTSASHNAHGWHPTRNRAHGRRDRTHGRLDKDSVETDLSSIQKKKKNDPWDLGHHNLTSKDSVTLTEAQFLLQTHEFRLENLHTSHVVDVSSSAHLAIKRDSLSSTHGQSRGSWPGSRGHGNTGRHNSGGRSPSNNIKLLCQICGKSGHSTLKCYHRFDMSFLGTSLPFAPSSFNPSTQSTQAYIATAAFCTRSSMVPRQWCHTPYHIQSDFTIVQIIIQRLMHVNCW